MASNENLAIGAFVIDPSRGVLTGADGEAALEPKVVDVLMTLAARPGEVVSRDALIDAVWKTEFGADERVTRAISLLRKAFGDERGAARYIETVSKRGYRLVAAVAPASQAAATPDAALAPEPFVTSAAPQPQTTSLRAAPFRPIVAIVAAVAALGFAAIALTMSQDWRATPTEDLIELRPFKALDVTPEFQTLAQQTHGTVKRILATYQLNVIDGAAGLPGAPRAAPEFVLAGSVESAANEIGVTLFLETVKDGQTLWSHRFARPPGDGQRLRDQAAAHTAVTIECVLRQRRVARVKPSIAALKVYFETCDPAFSWGEARVQVVAQRLIDAAPDDAYGHGLMALGNGILSGMPGFTEAEVGAFRERARRAASRALELDPASELPDAAIALALPPAEGWQERDIKLRRASETGPLPWDLYVLQLRAMGRIDEAVKMIDVSLAQAPLSARVKAFAAALQMQQGNHESALQTYDDILATWPDQKHANFFRFVALSFYGDGGEALGILAREPGANGFSAADTACWKTFIEARLAKERGGGRLKQACPRFAGDYMPRMLAALGDVDGAFEVIASERQDWFGVTIALFYPETKPLRHDRRFMASIVRSGLVEYWASSGRWPDFCGDKDLPYDCKTAAAEALQQIKLGKR